MSADRLVPGNGWTQRFLTTTRGQVVVLLRRGLSTVEELASALQLTDNAVRAHLAALERDGLVAQNGLRRGTGKPSYTYVLTPDAESLFPKAYGALLNLLLDVLAERMTPEEMAGLMRDVGHRLAESIPPPAGDLRQRVAAATELLGDIGGMARVEDSADGLAIVGRGCPLARAVEGHPNACYLAETMLTDLIGAPVRQVCDTAALHCRFEIAANGADTGSG